MEKALVMMAAASSLLSLRVLQYTYNIWFTHSSLVIVSHLVMLDSSFERSWLLNGRRWFIFFRFFRTIDVVYRRYSNRLGSTLDSSFSLPNWINTSSPSSLNTTGINPDTCSI